MYHTVHLDSCDLQEYKELPGVTFLFQCKHFLHLASELIEHMCDVLLCLSALSNNIHNMYE